MKHVSYSCVLHYKIMILNNWITALTYWTWHTGYKNMELFPHMKSISHTYYNLYLMTQTSLFWTPQQSQKHMDRKKLFKLTSPKFKTSHGLPDDPPIHLTQCSSPSLLQTWVEVVVAGVDHNGGLQIASFPPLPPHFPWVPNIQQMQREAKELPGTSMKGRWPAPAKRLALASPACFPVFSPGPFLSNC